MTDKIEIVGGSLIEIEWTTTENALIAIKAILDDMEIEMSGNAQHRHLHIIPWAIV